MQNWQCPIYNGTLEDFFRTVWIRYLCFVSSNCLFSLAGSMQQWLPHFKIEKVRYLTHFLSDEGFKGTVVNRTLSSLNYRSLDFSLTVPLCVRNHFSTNPSIQDGECTCLQRAPECASLSDTGWPGE